MTVNALILMAVVYGLTEMVKAILPDSWEVKPWVKVLSALGVAAAAVWLIAETRWAEQQFFGDTPLSDMDWAEKLVWTIFIAGGAALIQRTEKAVSNIGENPPDVYDPKYGTPVTKAPSQAPISTTATAVSATSTPAEYVSVSVESTPEPPPGYEDGATKPKPDAA
jgi:hypothetical protein